MRLGNTGNTLEAKLAAIDAAEAGEPGFLLPKKRIKELLGVGDTAIEELLSSETIGSVIVGNRRLGMRPSVFAHLRALARGSHAADGARLRVRTPSSMFTKARREPTQQELAALRRANATRHREALKRRAAAEPRRAVTSA